LAKYQLLPSLFHDEYEALKESIKKYGVIQPVVIDEEGNVLDGHHRVKICEELGIDYPTKVVSGLTEEEKENLAVSLNIKRRHLTKEQKKELAISLREKGWTQERIAGVMEVARTTILSWLKNVKTDNINIQTIQAPTPTQNLESIIAKRLKAAEREAERKLSEERERHKAELEAAKAEPTINQGIIDKLVEARTAEKLAELEQGRQKLKEEGKAAQERFNKLDKHFHDKKMAFEAQAATMLKEIEDAKKWATTWGNSKKNSRGRLLNWSGCGAKWSGKKRISVSVKN
jgi:ParB-like chromosome segregation protein Spo0J